MGCKLSGSKASKQKSNLQNNQMLYKTKACPLVSDHVGGLVS